MCTNPAYLKGFPVDWVAIAQTPIEELRAALAMDGSLEDNRHLLNEEVGHIEYVFVYGVVPGQGGALIPLDGSHINTEAIEILPTARGTVKLASSDPQGSPVINSNDYTTEADETIIRSGIWDLQDDAWDARGKWPCE